MIKPTCHLQLRSHKPFPGREGVGRPGGSAKVQLFGSCASSYRACLTGGVLVMFLASDLVLTGVR